MKTKLILLMLLMITLTSIAQNGINYKAIVKDDSGNIVANSLVQISIGILEGVNPVFVYSETHSPTTDDNGIIIINIGEGTVVSGVFNTIDWTSDDYFLNLDINIGDGWEDMGTTQFKTVPYAYVSDKSTSSLKASESDKILMFESGTSNPDKMVIQHSNAFPNWGLQYSDVNDSFDFLSGGTATLQVDLASGNLTTEGNIGVGTESPTSGLHVNTNSTVLNQNILIEEAGNDYARLGLKNSISDANWDIAGLASNTPTSAFLNFHYRNSSGAADRMTIRGDGNVGFGVSNPTSKLHVKLTGTSPLNALRLETSLTTSEDWYMYMDANDNLRFRNDGTDVITFEKNTGEVGIGTTNPTSKLHVNGTGRFTGTLNVDGTLRVGSWGNFTSSRINNVSRLSSSTNFTPSAEFSYSLGLSDRRWLAVWALDGTINTSDRRDKTNIQDMSYGLDDIMQLKPVSFNWKQRQEDGKKLGLIAQDLLQVIPEVVKTHEDIKDEETGVTQRKEAERMGVYYSDLIPVLIKAIQELKQENDVLTSKLNTKDEAFSALALKVNQIETLLKTTQQ